MATVPSRTPSQSLETILKADVRPRPERRASMHDQAVGTGCQAVTFYHTCGCKSKKGWVYFCNASGCGHTTPTLLLGELPFACGSQPGRSEACVIEDRARKEFVREVDTAEKLQKLLVLSNCNRADINLLIPSFVERTWDKDIHDYYKQRQSREFVKLPSQKFSATKAEPGISRADIEEVVRKLEAKFEIRRGPARSKDEQNREEDATPKHQRERTENTESGQRGQVEANIPHASHDQSQLDGLDCESKSSIAPHAGGVGANVDCTAEENIERMPNGAKLRDEGFLSTLNNVEGIPVKKEPRDGCEVIIPHSPNYLREALNGKDEITDDFIDFLLTDIAAKPEVKKTVMGKLWSYFRLC